MSGDNFGTLVLSDLTDKNINSKLIKDECNRSIKSLKEEIVDFKSFLSKEFLNTIFQDKMDLIVTELLNISPRITAIEKNIDNVVLYDKSDIKLQNEILNGYYSLTNYQKSIKDISDSIFSLKNDINSILYTDNLVKEIINSIEILKSRFSVNKELFKEWFKKDYSKLSKDFTAVVSDFDSFFGKASNNEISNKFLKDIKKEIGNISEKVSEHINLSNQKQKNHEIRLKMLKALRLHFTRLGFKEIEPYYIKVNDKNSNIIVQFNSLSSGNITFSLNLDNTISSNRVNNGSKITCEEQLNDLSKKIEEEFGIISEFKIAHNEMPIKPDGNQKRKSIEKNNTVNSISISR